MRPVLEGSHSTAAITADQPPDAAHGKARAFETASHIWKPDTCRTNPLEEKLGRDFVLHLNLENHRKHRVVLRLSLLYSSSGGFCFP